MVQSPLSLLILPGLALTVATVFAMGYAMAADARARGLGLGLAVVLGVVAAVVPMGLLLYYLSCRRLGPRQSTPTSRERAAWTLILAMVGAFVLAAMVSPPDPFTQLSQLPVFLLVSLPVAYLVVFKNGWRRAKALVR